MPQLMIWCERVLEGINVLQNDIVQNRWEEQNPNAFVYTLKNAISELEAVQEYLELIQHHYARQSLPKVEEVNQHLNEFNENLVFLKKNYQLERGRAKEVMDKGITLKQEVKAVGLYDSLEEKVVEMLLKTRHLVQILQITAGEKGLMSKMNQKDLLWLLEEKEKELGVVMQKYSDLKKKTLDGKLKDLGADELEKDVNELFAKIVEKKLVGLNELDSQKLENLKNYFEKNMVEIYGKKLIELENYFDENKKDIEEFFGKSKKLLNMIKYERDVTRKLFLENELEQSRLNAELSRKVMDLRDKEEGIEGKIRKDVEGKVRYLKEQLREQKELVSELKEVVRHQKQLLEKKSEKKEKTSQVADWLNV